MARWAYVEWQLSTILYKLAGVGPKQGRIAILELRANDYPNRFKWLLQVHKARVTTDLRTLAKDLGDAEDERNLLAHGLWIKDPESGELRIWRTRGAWESDSTNAGINRRLRPEASKCGPTEMRSLIVTIDELIRRLKSLSREIDAALAP